MLVSAETLRKWGGPVAVILGGVLLLALSNRSVTSRTGAPILTDGTRYNEALKKSEDLTLDRIHRFDAGESMTPEDKIPLMEAVKLTDGLSLVNPTEFAPYYLSGRLYVMLDDYENADERLHQCLLNGKNLTGKEAQLTLVDAHYLRSIALVGLKQYAAAFDEANRAVVSIPNSPSYLVARGSALLQLSRIPEAKKDIEAALKLDPTHVRALQLQKLLNVPASGKVR